MHLCLGIQGTIYLFITLRCIQAKINEQVTILSNVSHFFVLISHRAQRSYLCRQAKRKSYIRSHESPLFTVESTMNLTYQTVMRSCYKPGKILPTAQWERTSPEGDAFGKRSFPSEARLVRNHYLQRCSGALENILLGL